MTLELPPLSDNQAEDHIRIADWIELNLTLREVTSVSISGVATELAMDPPDEASVSEGWELKDSLGGEIDYEKRGGFREDVESTAERAIAELKERHEWLGPLYPISVKAGVAERQHGCPNEQLYKFLILLRARQLYSGALGDDGIEAGFLFEELAKHAFGSYAGAAAHSQVRFGVAGGTRGDGLPNPIEEAIEKLGAMMNEKPGKVPQGANGDFGADAIVWKSFGDAAPGQLVMIGQATITEGEWLRKEPSKKWLVRKAGVIRLLEFVAEPMTAVACPETQSLVSGTSVRGSSFSSVIFDRLRMVSVLSERELPAELRQRMMEWAKSFAEKIPSG